MATIHLSGTRLAPQKAKALLNKKFMYAIGSVFLIAMHIYIPNVGGSGLQLPFNSIVWAVLSIAFAIGGFHLTKTRQIKYSKLTITLFISALLMTAPLAYPTATNWPTALPTLIALWAGWTLFFIFQQFKLSNQHKQRLLWFIVLAAIIEAIFGYVQLTQLLSSHFNGYDNFALTPFGVFQHPSVMVSFLSTGVVLSGYLLARQQRKYGQKISRTLLLYLMPFFTIPLIVLLAQNLEWIGTAIGFTAIASYLYRFSTPQRLSGWIASSIAGIGLGMILLSSLDQNINASERAEENRLTLYPQAIDMFIEKPFTGYGYGRFEPEYILYTARQHQLNANYPPGVSSTQHPLNELLFWGVEGGVVPILGILLAAGMVLYRIYTARKGTRLAIFSLFIPIVLHSQMGMPFYISVPHWLTFIVLLYWVDQRTAKYKVYHFSTKSRTLLKGVSFILPITAIFCSVCVIQTNYVLLKYQQSSPKVADILSQAIQPIFQQHKYESSRYDALLLYGLTNNEEHEIKQYIEWSLTAIKQTPREPYYAGLILAYLGLGEVSKAEQIRSEATLLFPNYDFSSVLAEMDKKESD